MTARVPKAKVIDLDMFETSAIRVANLKAHNKKVICYISFGSWENWRPDKGKFPASVIGKKYDGWAGERWLDIRQIAILAPIFEARLDKCKAKGFDAVEPDNLDAYENDTGFNITKADQLTFINWLADAAHARGLSIGLKNVPEFAPQVVAKFDWALDRGLLRPALVRPDEAFHRRWQGCVRRRIHRQSHQLQEVLRPRCGTQILAIAQAPLAQCLDQTLSGLTRRVFPAIADLG